MGEISQQGWISDGAIEVGMELDLGQQFAPFRQLHVSTCVQVKELMLAQDRANITSSAFVMQL